MKKLPLLGVLLIIFLLPWSINAQTIATDNFSLPALTGSGPYNFQRITFDTPFPAGTTPIVTVTSQNGSDESMTLRIFNIDNTGFDVIQTEPARTAGNGDCGNPTSDTTPCDGAHAAVDASYLAVTPGSQTLSDGTLIVAGINNTNTVQHRINNNNIRTGWNDIPIGTTFSSTPVILAQIQTMNNETNLTIGSPNQMTSTSEPFMNAAVRNVTTNSFQNAIELTEVDDGTGIFQTPITAVNEQIGWIAISNNANTTINFNGSTYGFATSTFTEIRGKQNGCNTNTISNIPSTCASPIVLSSMNTRNGNNGGWNKNCSQSTTNTLTGTDVTLGFNIEEDQDRDTERSHINENVGTVVFCDPITLPVSIEFVELNYENKKLSMHWMTSSETHSLAFEVWAQFDNQWQKIGQPVKSIAASSLLPQNYYFSIDMPKAAEEYFIHHISTTGKKQYFGPYFANQTYGKKYKATSIDWSTLHSLKHKNTIANSLKLNVKTTKQGMHRIYAEQIPAFIGQNVNHIALTLSGNPVGRIVNNVTENRLFSAQSSIDFYADTPAKNIDLYLKNNTYQLSIDPDRVRPGTLKKLTNSNVISSYPQLMSIEKNTHYDFSTPLNDPWYQQRVFRSTQNNSANITFIAPNMVSNSTFTLRVDLYGVTDYDSYDTDGDGQINDDHHFALYLNQNLIHDEYFDGHVGKKVIINQLDSSLLTDGENTLTIELINDTGYPFDLIHIDAIYLHSDVNAKAEDSMAHFILHHSINDRSTLQIGDFLQQPEMAFAFKNNKLIALELFNNDDTSVKIPTVKNAKNYWLGKEQHLLPVTVNNQNQSKILPNNTGINYLVIAHPQFLKQNNDHSNHHIFENYLKTKNLVSQWVNVHAIYDQFGHGMATPLAIQKYIKKAVEISTIEYVLLVGGDSYDYHDNLSIGSISHIPSWYTTTHDAITHTPTDIPYVDLNNDKKPDIAIGRWPVKSIEDLNKIINNTVNMSRDKVNHVLTIAENTDPDKNISYSKQLENLLSDFNMINHQSISLDQLMIENNTINPHEIIDIAQAELLDGINQGSNLIMFSGHGSPTAWTFYGLFSPQTAENIDADGKQFYLPLACYTSYYNSPTHYSLAHQLMFGGTQGSSGIAGAVTLSHYSDNETIAQLILQGLEQGQSIGQATLNAKKQLSFDQYKDVIINWATLAEPSLTLR